ncbi:hypothetical protein [Oculatella sp. LEGE 06141]|uniref:hypothetical protein n=1 Tax=Oculatella sp. LEGE 06141 TaxID=1828648 RepID=UPI001D13D62F|nr:hypothetical protein [Oculatella sp. LEGE 06141]
MEEHSFASTVAETLDSNPLLLRNWEAIEQLKEENKQIGMGWVVAATGLFGVMTAPLAPVYLLSASAAAFPVMQWTQWRAAKVFRLLQTGKLLLEKFEAQGVEIYFRIPVEEANPIDLFVRFPKKTHLFIALRSKGNTKIIYNEAIEEISVKKKKGRASRWEPNPLVELSDQERWLTKNRDLFGMTSREASKTPTAKVLVVCSPTKIDEHREELYSEVGTFKTLALRRKGTAFVIQEEELLDFVAAWLAKYE